MSSALHPWIHEASLAMSRAGWRAFVRRMGIPVMLLLLCVALASVGLRRGSPWWLLAGVAVAVSGSYAITRSASVRTLVNWHSGWCGALPIEPRVARRTLLLMTGGALALGLVCVSALLSLSAIGAPHSARLPVALVMLDAGLVFGTAVATIVALRSSRGARAHHAGVIREPLFALRCLNDPRLPHLLDWQRRDALVRWRAGGNFVWIGVLLVSLPHGVIFRIAIGMVVLALSLMWLVVVMRACADVAADAVRLLTPVPLNARHARIASLRYPLVAAVFATILAGCGAVLLDFGMVMGGWLACTVALAAWPLYRIVTATRNPEGST